MSASNLYGSETFQLSISIYRNYKLFFKQHHRKFNTLLFIIYVVLFNISKWQCSVFKFQCLDVQELTFNYPGERRVKLCWII